MPCDDAVRAVEDGIRHEAQNAREGPRQAERPQELPTSSATPDRGSVCEHEPPAGLALRNRHAVQQLTCARVVQREEPELLAAVEPGDDPRRPAAEASLGVVQQHRPAKWLHGSVFGCVPTRRTHTSPRRPASDRPRRESLRV
jgi:hypothetical protein